MATCAHGHAQAVVTLTDVYELVYTSHPLDCVGHVAALSTLERA